MQPKRGANKKSVKDEIEKLKQRREERKIREDKKGQNINIQPETNKLMDIEYERMILKKKNDIYQNEPKTHKSSENAKIFVLVRKRPMSKKEIANGEIDCISCLNPKIIIHECKIKIDGFTKYLEDHEFYFDNTFSEHESTEDIYNCAVKPMIDLVLDQGIVTCFAYGQTGSGKTYTMKGIQNLSIESLFEGARKSNKKLVFYVSFFEIYGGRLYDLLNNKNKLQVLDDKNGKVQIYGLEEILVETPELMKLIIEKGNGVRTTHNTVTNETSSRSHAICNITIKVEGKNEEYGKLSLVDLAGSERAQETQSNNRQRRAEGAEINKSLLALKECIRALDARKSGNNDIHVPFRASKLTHVLRDSFVSKSNKSKIIMISCVSPSYVSSNHSINTLRYSDRLKEQTSAMSKQIALNFNNVYYVKKPNNNNKPNINFYPKSKNPNNKKMNKSFDNDEGEGNLNNKYENDNNYKDLDDINMDVFQDDILNEIKFDDKIDLNEFGNYNNENNGNNDENNENNDQLTPRKEENDIPEDIDDLTYLKKTISKEGKYISDDFIKFQQIHDKIIEDEDEIVNTHMIVIKDDAKLLTEESELITKIKKIESNGDDEDFKIEEYIQRLEKIIDKKINLYSGLKVKLDVYKGHIKEEDELIARNPSLFVDPAEV